MAADNLEQHFILRVQNAELAGKLRGWLRDQTTVDNIGLVFDECELLASGLCWCCCLCCCHYGSGAVPGVCFSVWVPGRKSCTTPADSHMTAAIAYCCMNTAVDFQFGINAVRLQHQHPQSVVPAGNSSRHNVQPAASWAAVLPQQPLWSSCLQSSTCVCFCHMRVLQAQTPAVGS
jgi:hypothetical protein